MSSLPPPFVLSDYHRIRRVGSFDELVSTPFADGVNALCWQRSLAGNFEEVVQCLNVAGGMAELDDETLRGLSLSAAGKAAVEILIADRRLLHDRGLAPVLDCIESYPRDDEPGVVRTDVYSWHADSATIEADTYLCSYTESASQGLPNEAAIRRVDVPETRARLLELYGGKDDADFVSFLHEHCYDLHYAAEPGVKPFEFGLGNMWRIAVEYPGSPVPPCVHRAPENLPGRPPRLLLIS